MKFLKLTDKLGRNVLVNVSNITHIYEIGDLTIFAFPYPEDFLQIPTTIDKLAIALDLLNNSECIVQEVIN